MLQQELQYGVAKARTDRLTEISRQVTIMSSYRCCGPGRPAPSSACESGMHNHATSQTRCHWVLQHNVQLMLGRPDMEPTLSPKSAAR